MKSIDSLKGPAQSDQLRRYGPEVLRARWNLEMMRLAAPLGEATKAVVREDALETASFLAWFYPSEGT